MSAILSARHLTFEKINRIFRNLLGNVRQCVALLLVITFASFSVPPVTAAEVAKAAVASSRGIARAAQGRVRGWVRSVRSGASGLPQESNGMPARPINSSPVGPQRRESRSEREARAVSLRLNTGSTLNLQSRERIMLSAILIDGQGETVQGMHADWESSDRAVVRVNKDGEAIAGIPGNAMLTAQAGRLTQIVQVTVVESDLDDSGGRRRADGRQAHDTAGRDVSQAGRLAIASRSLEKREYAHAKPGREVDLGVRSSSSRAESSASFIKPLAAAPPIDDPLPNDQTASLYLAANAVGAPPGKTTPGARVHAASTNGTENPGSENFTFGLPVAFLPGRGLDVSLSLVHNSQLWNMGDSGVHTLMTYNVDSGWPAPGWRLGYGQMEYQGSAGFTLTEADGTRHGFAYYGGNEWETTDGTFIHYSGGSGSGTLYYSDGTQVTYGAGGGGTLIYPTKIMDRNGNNILISYAGTNGVGPKIATIEDTLHRFVNFWYATNGDLVTITSPGFGTQSEREVMRLYYDTISLTTSGLFQSGTVTPVNTPTSVRVVKYIYLPNSVESGDAHIGYRFDYTSYGMMYQTTQFRGMTASWSSYTDAGSNPTEGSNTIAATTTYNYEGASSQRPIPSGGLTAKPSFTTRTDDWAGRVSAQPVYTFSVDTANGISTVTAPDGSVTETDSIVGGQWNAGLVSDTYIDKQGSSFLQRSHMDWSQDSAGNPRVSQVLSTDSAGNTKATVLSYTTYNNVSVVSERDFTTNGTAGTELRRTETTYETSSNYINRHLLHLPTMVKVFPGSSTTAASRVDYEYDNYGTNHAYLTPRNDIIRHDAAFDPFNQSGTTDYRANVTKVTTYTDAGAGSGAITHSTKYDIAGNVMSADLDCCQQKSFTYSGAGSGGDHDYAYPISTTKGGGGTTLSTSATYDHNTGLLSTATDENGRVTTNYYDGNSLRIAYVQYPNGATTAFYYGDGLSGSSSTNGLHYFVNTSTRLDSSRYVDSYRFYDGRGAVTQTFDNYAFDSQLSSSNWSTQDIEYDVMGRAYRSGNPYYSGGYGWSAINPTGLWSSRTFDHLGRVTGTTTPSGDDNNATSTSASISYAGVFTTVTDQALKLRRQKVDALGRLIRLDEPNSSGLGDSSSPVQPTAYDYDTLDNLIHTTQAGPNSVTQNRYFKYDSLSRLTYERQVEQSAPWTASDSATGNSSWSRKLIYNSSGLVTDAYDARQIHTTLGYDGLNRVQTITYSDSTPTAHYYYDSATGLPSGAPSSSSPDSYSPGYAAGRLVAMTYGSGATGNYFSYDNMGQVSTQWQLTGSSTPTKYKLSYGYNLGGLLTSETYPSGRALTLSYDGGGRLSQVNDGSTTYTDSFQYTPHGGLSSERFGNSAVHSMNYNHALQASQVKLSINNSEKQRFDYWYGTVNQSDGSLDTSHNNGQIARVDGYIDSAKQWDQRFSYDELGRLGTAAEYRDNGAKTWQQKFSYDRWGNRFQNNNGSSTDNTGVGYTPVVPGDIDAATNRFISTGPVTYDGGTASAGNITYDGKFRFLSYGYDANNRQTSASNGTWTESQVYDAGGQRVQTSVGSATRTMVYDIFGQDVADYSGSTGGTLERENIYRGGQLLASWQYTPATAQNVSWTNAVGVSVSGNSLTKTASTGWLNSGAASTQTIASGDGYVEFTTTETNTHRVFGLNHSDTDQSYNSLDFAFYPAGNGILYIIEHANVIGSYGAYASGDHLRVAIEGGVVKYRKNGTLLYTSTVTPTYPLLVDSALYETGGTITNAVISSAVLTYVLSDLQGSARAAISNNNTSSSVVARHDYLPFGEEIGSGVGLRTNAQGYGPAAASDTNRKKYGLTERDDTSGLDHTWFRKYESLAGRWTSPDPYRGSMKIGDPQSLNRFSYTRNDPANFVDPSGLRYVLQCELWSWFTKGPNPKEVGPRFKQNCHLVYVPDSVAVSTTDGDPAGFGIAGQSQLTAREQRQQKFKDCLVKAEGRIVDETAIKVKYAVVGAALGMGVSAAFGTLALGAEAATGTEVLMVPTALAAASVFFGSGLKAGLDIAQAHEEAAIKSLWAYQDCSEKAGYENNTTLVPKP